MHQMRHTLFNQVILKIKLILEKQSLTSLHLKLITAAHYHSSCKKKNCVKRTTKTSLSPNHCLNLPLQFGQLHTFKKKNQV